MDTFAVLSLDDVLGSVHMVEFQHIFKDEVTSTEIHGDLQLEVIETVVTEVVVWDVVGLVGCLQRDMGLHHDHVLHEEGLPQKDSVE